MTQSLKTYPQWLRKLLKRKGWNVQIDPTGKIQIGCYVGDAMLVYVSADTWDDAKKQCAKES